MEMESVVEESPSELEDSSHTPQVGADGCVCSSKDIKPTVASVNHSAPPKSIAVTRLCRVATAALAAIMVSWYPGGVFTASSAALALFVALCFTHTRFQRSALLLLGHFLLTLDEIKRLYLVSRRPRRIILIRHGESEGNADRNVYKTVPDHALSLTVRGEEQARVAGERLRALIPGESCFFYLSPYKRCRMTYQIVRDALRPSRYVAKEDPRLREQDFGHFQDPDNMRDQMAERNAFGRFWYRFRDGESGADVFDRASAFWDSLFRMAEISARHSEDSFDNIIIVTHGLMMRLFLMRYFQWTVEDFHLVYNPDNCAFIVLELEGNGAYQLAAGDRCLYQPRAGGQGEEEAAASAPADPTNSFSSKNGGASLHHPLLFGLWPSKPVGPAEGGYGTPQAPTRKSSLMFR